MLKRMYNWVLSWGSSQHAGSMLFFLALAEATFFPIPPDVLLIALAVGNQKKALHFASICTIGSIIGGFIGYCIGHYLWWNGSSFSEIAIFFYQHIPGFTEEVFLNIKNKYDLYGFAIVFTAGFTPIPYKVFTISAGAFSISLPMFIGASIVSRGARFFIVAILINKFGEKVKSVIDKYFNILSIVFVVLLFGSFFLVTYYFN
ncbi:MAG: DedA family protein [Candidatus Marinimicrobia bacterium]|nr:DedA family protein [Candidatus Neomarinimicrobiota bacterium]